MTGEKVVEVTRGALVESLHRGHVAVANAKNGLLYSLGDPQKVIYARSSMKPLQAIPLVETGAADRYRFDNADISLACASHNGEDQHTERVQAILTRTGLAIGDLRCGTHNPKWEAAYEALIKSGEPLTAVYNNCSGKHSGMLATAKHMNESTEDYYKLGHPVQQRILEAISDLTEVPADKIVIGVDGCGVPVHGVPIENLALSFAKMADPSSLPEKRRAAVQRITTAMAAEPEMVGGTDRFCTDFMRVMGGRMFAKAGAEGVYCIGDKETGLGIALKIEDGNARATSAVAVEVLSQLGLLSEVQKEQLRNYHYPSLENARKEKIGELSPAFTLKENIAASI
ncbi:asparaginase [Planomicrobium sp. CPCC 101079]|uniref:asparaginase n=1 Tax=Planomicrobium sp. CPCC 101079 TaxID=2599618 RepID=UPI0011B48C1B|nr:asparaginase [Planomicrobium sp. CPCC 101079]TWT13342.1 asparaginase [Planomicrobium sp. CPCC 101079]